MVHISKWFSNEIPDRLIRPFEEACALINNFHVLDDPSNFQRWSRIAGGNPLELPLNPHCVVVTEYHERGSLGRYTPSSRDAGEHSVGPLMEIAPKQANPCLTILHESFHMIHLEILDPRRTPSERVQKQFLALQETIGRTWTYRQSQVAAYEASLRLKRLTDAGAPENLLIIAAETVAFFNYIASMIEWLARSYSQVVYDRYQHLFQGELQDLKVYLDRVDTLDIRQYLDSRGIQAVDKELSRLFGMLGWRESRWKPRIRLWKGSIAK